MADTTKFRYVIAVVGEIPARNHSAAYMLVYMGFSLVGRLLAFPYDLAVKVEKVVGGDKSADDLAGELLNGKEGVDG